MEGRVHAVGVVAMNGVVPGDLTTPCEVLGLARDPGGAPAYDVRVCAQGPRVDAGLFHLSSRWGWDALVEADTVIVPGVRDVQAAVPPALSSVVRESWQRGARVASICTGAFVLAAAGLLRGRRVTTHWAAAPALAARYPDLEVDPSVLYVDHGRLLTSAGAAAGLDLCLHLIRRDLGAACAANAARMAVMPLERDGGQAQFIEHAPPVGNETLQPLLDWVEDHLTADLSVAALAQRAGRSPRSFARHFVAQTGTTPARWVQLARVRRAQQLLESARWAPEGWSVERVAEAVGFGSATTLRDRFRAVTGTSPTQYRRAFRADGPRAGSAGSHASPGLGR